MTRSSFTVTFPIEFWTRFRASRTLSHRLWGTWLAYAFFVGMPTAFLIYFLVKGLDLSRRGSSGLPLWVPLSGGYFFVFIFMPLLQMLQLWMGGRRNRTLAGEQTETIAPEGFSASGPAFNTSLKWEAVHRAVETRHFFFVHLSARSAYYIPKARLTGPEDVATVRELLKLYLQERAHVRTGGSGKPLLRAG